MLANPARRSIEANQQRPIRKQLVQKRNVVQPVATGPLNGADLLNSNGQGQHPHGGTAATLQTHGTLLHESRDGSNK